MIIYLSTTILYRIDEIKFDNLSNSQTHNEYGKKDQQECFDR